MKKTSYALTRSLVLSAFAAGAASVAQAQYAPPPPPAPFPGFLNEYLRKNDPYMNQWDIGGVERRAAERRQALERALRALGHIPA